MLYWKHSETKISFKAIYGEPASLNYKMVRSWIKKVPRIHDHTRKWIILLFCEKKKLKQKSVQVVKVAKRRWTINLEKEKFFLTSSTLNDMFTHCEQLEYLDFYTLIKLSLILPHWVCKITFTHFEQLGYLDFYTLMTLSVILRTECVK
jgi:RAB protein geranylgeranyltransferase component A